MTDHRELARNAAGAAVNVLRRGGMLGLLLLLVTVVFIVPALPFEERFLRLGVDILMTLILAIGIVAVAEHRKILVLLGPLCLVSIAIRWSASMMPLDLLPALRETSSLLSMLVLAIAVGITVFGKGVSAVDRILGAVVLYLLLGIEWAVCYAIIDGMNPLAFTGGHGKGFEIQHWVYYSFVTLTTVGYGDIVPVARGAQSMAILEALVGQLYPAVILARLVSLPQERP